MEIATFAGIATKLFLLAAFVMFIPISAACYYFSRHQQRHSELERYIEILKIKKIELFEYQHPVVSLSLAVLFVTFLSVCFWVLIFFGYELNITGSPNYLLGGANIIGLSASEDVLKGTSINCLCPLRDLKHVAARREPQQNGYSILQVRNAADACFRSRPTGLTPGLRLSVALS